MKIRTRFAPSPTGYLHIGGARTALFNWLYAKQHNGEYILRIEDTDRERSKNEFTENIFSSLKWLKIESDIEPIYQSKRTEKYQKVIEKLLDEGNAYHCYCSKQRLDDLREEQMRNKQKPRYDGHCRTLSTNNKPKTSSKPVVRFKNPQEDSISLEDQVRGNVTVNNSELDDLIIARSDGSPTYHLTVVVDDIDLAITHVIRGDDHLNNSFRQYNIFNALNAAIPTYAHIPLIHGKDGKRLSKRHGAVSVSQYKAEGILADALLNYLARLGWSHGDQEVFTIAEMIELFNLSSVQKSPATFDMDKLLWVNQQHMKKLSAEDVRNDYQQYKDIHTNSAPISDNFAVVWSKLKDRSKTLQEFDDSSAFIYNDIEEYDVKAAKKLFIADNIQVLSALKAKLSKIDSWSAENIHTNIKLTAEDLGLKMGKIAPPLRLAVTGGADSPSIDVTLELLGNVKCLERIDQAIDYIRNTV